MIQKTKLLMVVLRGAGLSSKFILAAVLIQIYSVKDYGYFSFVGSLAATVPAIVGFGINYYLGRIYPQVSGAKQKQILLDRFCFSVLSSVALVPIGLYLFSLYFSLGNFWLVLVLVVFEILVFDLHYGLIGIGEGVRANVLLFVRTGLWAIGFSGLALVFRLDVEYGLKVWIVFDFLVVVYYFSYLLLNGAAFNEVKLVYFIKGAWGNKRIYVSDVALAIYANLDKLLVGGVLGVADLGVYNFYATFAAAVHVLVWQGGVQSDQYQLGKAYQDKSLSLRKIVFNKIVKENLILAIGISLGVSCAVVAFARYKGGGFEENIAVFFILIFSMIVKIYSDILSIALYFKGNDRGVFYSNIISLLIVFVGLLVIGNGMLGISISVAVAQITTCTYRYRKYSYENSLR